MPKPQLLPEDLALLTRRNAVELSDIRWQSDVSKLVSVLERILSGRAETRKKSVQTAVDLKLRDAEIRETGKTRAEEGEARDRAEQERSRNELEESRRKRDQEHLRLAKDKRPKRGAEVSWYREEGIRHKEPDQTSSIEGLAPARRSYPTTARAHSTAPTRPFMNIALWSVQVLLVLLFLFAGGIKLLMPIDALTSMASPSQVHLPGLLIRFIGVSQVLGALGLVLPGLMRIKPWLTPLAAAWLMIIMIGAIVLALIGDGVGAAVLPFLICLLLVFVAYGRSRQAVPQSK